MKLKMRLGRVCVRLYVKLSVESGHSCYYHSSALALKRNRLGLASARVVPSTCPSSLRLMHEFRPFQIRVWLAIIFQPPFGSLFSETCKSAFMSILRIRIVNQISYIRSQSCDAHEQLYFLSKQLELLRFRL